MENTPQYRPTKVIVDLQAIKQNVLNLQAFLQKEVQIIAVVKANAYGHGVVEVSRAAIEGGATILAVATPDEAVYLRRYFSDIEILVLGASPVSFVPYASENNVLLTVFSEQWIQQASEIYTLTKPLKLHIKVDTGMGRIGVTDEQQIMSLYKRIVANPLFEVDGIFTHFATADEEDSLYFDKQIKTFVELLAKLPIKPRLTHVANTATALTKDSAFHFDAVRYGISMYGLAPSDFVANRLPFPLAPAFSMETELVHVKKMLPGQFIGYGATFEVKEECYVGTIPVGYADGMIRRLSGQFVIIGDEYAPIVGRICMDQCMIMLKKEYKVGERVVLVGAKDNKKVTLDDWAKKLETINYEVPCVITSRVPRLYKK